MGTLIALMTAAALAEGTTPPEVLDQNVPGSYRACVGYSLYAWLMTGPDPATRNAPGPLAIWQGAKERDGGSPAYLDRGTHVDAGLRFLQERGYVTGWSQTGNWDTLITWMSIGAHAAVLETEWTDTMESTDTSGQIHYGGQFDGRHAFLCYRYDPASGLLGCQNSVGPGFGQGGRFTMKQNTFETLMYHAGTAWMPAKASGAKGWSWLLEGRQSW